MATLKAGDLAALISGSPRMAVESVEGDNVSLVWCNEGVIYRDTFDKILLKRWEVREGGNDRGGDRGGRGGERGGDRGLAQRDPGPTVCQQPRQRPPCCRAAVVATRGSSSWSRGAVV